ncbi:Mif2/CENP-C like-domain-containing protein [Flagelloscypha sp. PMI_526]|nr:Mif2/CENP-C like-domain-containing protein [Flagelloscypha sp. PMI_526]
MDVESPVKRRRSSAGGVLSAMSSRSGATTTFDDTYDGDGLSQASFSRMNASDDSEPEDPEPEPEPEPVSVVSKGRALSAVPEEDEEFTQDISQMGMEVDPPDFQQEDPSPTPPPRTKIQNKPSAKPPSKPKSKVTTTTRRKKENLAETPTSAKRRARSGSVAPLIEKIPRSRTSDEDTTGLRRSTRYRYTPLAFWRLEKPVYARPTPPPSDEEDSDDELGLRIRKEKRAALPYIKELERYPEEPVIPLGKAGRNQRAAKARESRSGASKPREVRIVHEIINRHYNDRHDDVANHRNSNGTNSRDPDIEDTEDWDYDTQEKCIVLKYPEIDVEVNRRIAAPKHKQNPIPSKGGGWHYEKLFDDANYTAQGILILPPGGKKPSKGSKDNTFHFFVHEGAVNLAIHNSNRLLAKGACFMVPRGNTYFIQNVSQTHRAFLVFTQSRKLREGEESDFDEDEDGEQTTQTPEGEKKRDDDDPMSDAEPTPAPVRTNAGGKGSGKKGK